MWVLCASNRPINLYKLAQARYDNIAKALRPTSFWPNIRFHFKISSREDIIYLSRMAEENLKAFPEPERLQVFTLASLKLE